MGTTVTMGYVIVDSRDLLYVQVHPTATGLHRMRQDASDASFFDSEEQASSFKENFLKLSPNTKVVRVSFFIPK